MGGSGGGRGSSFGNLDALRNRAREELKGQEGRRNVFISFVEEDLDEVNLLRGQAKNDSSDIDFNDWSVKVPYDSERAEYIRGRITERIEKCSVTVVYISDHTADSKWVNWEIGKSIELGKKVIAVHKSDSPPAKVPVSVRDNKIEIVSWRDLADRIRKL